ncbi:MAG TPA: twin-arginine translocase subunit TatC [Gammaproteobacteria bacterium]
MNAKRNVEPEEEEQLAEGTLISHLIELRSRIMKSMLAVLVVFIALVPFANRIFTWVADPLRSQLGESGSLIATRPASPFLTPFKTTLFVALFVAMPIVLYQAWQFVAPGLYRREKRFAIPLLVSSVVLFYAGVAFAYYVVFDIMFRFFVASTPEGVAVMTDIGEYLTFVLTLSFAFGVSFEVPIATVLLIWSGLVNVESLKKARPYVFLGCFVIGMFLTPPDVLSQTLLALPMYMLYEGGLILARFLVPERTVPEEAET